MLFVSVDTILFTFKSLNKGYGYGFFVIISTVIIQGICVVFLTMDTGYLWIDPPTECDYWLSVTIFIDIDTSYLWLYPCV